MSTGEGTCPDENASLWRKRDWMAVWAPRRGREAAELTWRASQDRVYMFFCMAPAVGLFIAGVRADIPVLIGVGAFLYLAAVWFIVHSGVYLVRANRVMSHLFGFKVGWGHSGPPRGNTQYARWCETHGLTPYAADNP